MREKQQEKISARVVLIYLASEGEERVNNDDKAEVGPGDVDLVPGQEDIVSSSPSRSLGHHRPAEASYLPRPPPPTTNNQSFPIRVGPVARRLVLRLG